MLHRILQGDMQDAWSFMLPKERQQASHAVPAKRRAIRCLHCPRQVQNARMQTVHLKACQCMSGSGSPERLQPRLPLPQRSAPPRSPSPSHRAWLVEASSCIGPKRPKRPKTKHWSLHAPQAGSCPSCGRVFLQDAVFCSGCGKRRDGSPAIGLHLAIGVSCNEEIEAEVQNLGSTKLQSPSLGRLSPQLCRAMFWRIITLHRGLAKLLSCLQHLPGTLHA